MELMLDNVTYKSLKTDKNLLHVSYVFKEVLTFVNGLSGILLKELLFQEHPCESGFVMVNEHATKKDIGYVGSVELNKFSTDNVNDEMTLLNTSYHLNYHDINKRIDDALLLVGLSANYHNALFKDLSLGELKRIQLACVLFINPQIIIFDYYDKNVTNKDMEYINKLIHKLVKMFHKNIIVCSDNIGVYLNNISNIIIFKGGKIVYQGDSKAIYDDELYKYIAMPKIVEYIKYLNNKGHKMDNYIDIKELLKAIYRDVENK